MARMLQLLGLVLLVIGLSCGASTNRKNKPSRQPVLEEVEDGPTAIQSSDECPEPYAYFADVEQCDKYYECKNGQITDKLCPDGMVFNDFSIEYEKCDLPFNIDCSQRPKLQEPQPSQNCPRKHGYFPHSNPSVCDKFYYCVDGQFNMITCPSGLVYNPKTGICAWPDEAKKKGCSSEEVFQFDCPKVNETFGLTHPRYADPEDCQYFYVCINGNVPRRNGCKLGQVFDDVGKKCEWARKVPECADWYKGRLTDEELDKLENPPTPRPRPADGSPVRRRKPQRPSSKNSESA